MPAKHIPTRRFERRSGEDSGMFRIVVKHWDGIFPERDRSTISAITHRCVVVEAVIVINYSWYLKGDCYAYLLVNPRRLSKQLTPVKQSQRIWFSLF